MSHPQPMKTITLTRPSAVLFDWDNTLIDSWPVIHEALNNTLEEWKKPAWTLEQTKQRVARSMRDSFPEMFGDEWEKAGDHYLGQYRGMHLEKLAVFEQAEAVLGWLQDKGVLLGVVSNKTGETLRKESTHLGWDSYFHSLVGAGDADADKPSAVPIHKALSGTELQAGPDVWLVGDSITDVECARNSGCTLVFYGDRFGHEGGEITLQDGELHAPDHAALLALLEAALIDA